MGNIAFILCAPSGTGKTTICKALAARDSRLARHASHTTRPPRPGEQEGVDHHFVSRTEFRRMQRDDAFLEWTEYDGHAYGTHRDALQACRKAGRDLLLEIDIRGVRQFKELYKPGQPNRPDMPAVFLLLQAPSREERLRRLRSRGTEDEDAIQRRIRAADGEIQSSQRLGFDYTLPNENLEKTVTDILAILHAERRLQSGG